jgi:hypothetical protein
MHWTTQIFVICVILGALAWVARARLLAACVSWLATRGKGVAVRVERVAFHGATNLVLTFCKDSFVKDVRCRRVQIGWTKREEKDREDGHGDGPVRAVEGKVEGNVEGKVEGNVEGKEGQTKYGERKRFLSTIEGDTLQNAEDEAQQTGIGTKEKSDKAGKSGRERNDGGLIALLVSMTKFRVCVSFVGVRVRLNVTESDISRGDDDGGGAADAAADAAAADGDDAAADGAASDGPRSGSNKRDVSDGANHGIKMLLKSVLGFVSVDFQDIEVSYTKNDESLGQPDAAAVVLRGKKIGLDMRRAEQSLVMEHVFVCPGSREVQGDRIVHDWGLIELDSLSCLSKTSLHDMMEHVHAIRGKKGPANDRALTAAIELKSIRINADPRYLGQLRAIKYAFCRRKKNDVARVSKTDGPVTARGPLHLVAGETAHPVAIEAALNNIMVKLPGTRRDCHHQANFRDLSVSCHSSTLKRGIRDGTVETSVSWDHFSLTLGMESTVALACQSSLTESNLAVYIPMNGSGHPSITVSTNIGALHTKVHHEHAADWLSAMRRKDPEKVGVESVGRGSVIIGAFDVFDLNLDASLGNGSSMQFIDSREVCMLHHSLDSASVKIKGAEEGWEFKFDVCGIAMAECAQDVSEEDKRLGLQSMTQVLSNRSFSGGICFDSEKKASITVSIRSMAGKLSFVLMENVCSISRSILKIVQREANNERPAVLTEGERNPTRGMYSLRADLLDIDLAVLSTYVVEKHQSSVNAIKELDTAVSLRLQNLGISRTAAGLWRASTDDIKILYYEGMREFSLDFDCMERFVTSTPFHLQQAELQDTECTESDSRRRLVKLGPAQVSADADALISMMHFSKSMRSLNSIGQKDKRSIGKGSFLDPKTIISAEELSVRVPVSSDREISIMLMQNQLELSKEHISHQMVRGSIFIKGVETLSMKDTRVLLRQSTCRSLEIHAGKVALILPHDRDPGPTMKIFSLYIKACAELMREVAQSRAVGTLKEPVRDHPGSPPSPLDIKVNIARGTLKFDHHPLESWFAGQSGNIRRASLIQHLWDEAHSSVVSEKNAPLTPLGLGKSTSDTHKKSTPRASQSKSWKNVMSKHASWYVKDLVCKDETASLYQTLFQVDFDNVELNAVSEVSSAKAQEFIRLIDPPSEEIRQKSSMLFDLVLSGGCIDVKFGGCNRPLYSGSEVSLQGKVAVAKQATASPERCKRLVHIGMHHVKEILVPLRGTCPPMKVFTDISMRTRTSQVFFSPGMEPILGLMGITSKRLIPTDPDSFSKKPPPVPWWDDLRYFWRGKLRIDSQSLGVTLSPGTSPVFSGLNERLEIQSEDIMVDLRSGVMFLESGPMRVLAFRKTLEQNGGQLFAFPVADLKCMTANISVTWKLPGGKDPMQHYIFPSPQSESSKQSPIFVADVYKASAVDVFIDISLDRRDEELDPPMLYIGGEIVSFWRKFVRDWEVPTYIKNQVRRGTFFVRKPKLNVKKVGLPKLLEGLKIRVASQVLYLTHFTLDGNDPGGGLMMGTSRGEFQFEWNCNKEVSISLSSPSNPSESSDLKMEKPRKTVMSHLDVTMEHVTIKSLQFSTDGDITPPISLFNQTKFPLDTSVSLSSSSQASYADQAPEESSWLAERVTIVKSRSDDADAFGEDAMEPLRVSVDGCYFMTDLEFRDAIWATIEHLIAAFAPARTPAPLRSITSDNLQFQRSHSTSACMNDGEGEKNELLALLLQQKDSQGPSPLASPQGAIELDRNESMHAEVDFLPMTSDCDDSSSEIKYEVEVTNMQLILQRDNETGISTGRMLLATKSATLTGSATSTHNITSLVMEDVQAYISLALIDPSSKVVWLGVSEKEFVAPSVEERESVWRRVFNPINMNLRHFKYQSGVVRQVCSQLGAGVSAGARQGEELLLKIPEIAAVMDGREFEVLIDVVNFLITSGPTVQTCLSVQSLRRDIVNNDMVANEQMKFELAYHQLGCIRNEAICLVEAIKDCQNTEVWSLSEPLPFSGALLVTLDLESISSKQPSDVLRLYVEDSQRDTLHDPFLLLHWSQEQEEISLQAYQVAKANLEHTTESLKRQTQVKNASRVLIHLNRVVWQLCNEDRIPFVQASIRKATFDRRRNRDRSGSVRLTIHRLDVMDATGVLPEGPATSAGVILTTWNPESSYEREPMLRIISTLGVPTSKFDVFEHLDATLHPLSLHLTEQIATACWEYFFPKEDQKSRQEAFSSSISGKKMAHSMQNSPRKSSFTVPENASETSSPLVKQESDVSSRAETTARISSPGLKRRDSPLIKRKVSAVRPQKRFKYVKLNRAHMRITYTGKPIGIKDRVLVINSYDCENLDGNWRDLLSNVKQKAIFSALFSGLGLQGRKVKELMIGAAPSIASVEIPTSEEEDRANNRGLLAKLGLKHGTSSSSHRKRDDDAETQKKRALFGESIMRHLHHGHKGRPTTSSANSPRADVSPSYDFKDSRAESESITRKNAVALLELTEPLPPEDTSEESASDMDDFDDGPAELGTEFTRRGGPLGAGLTTSRSSINDRQSSMKHQEQPRSQRPAPYDPNVPPSWSVRQEVAHKAGPMESFHGK